MSAFVAVFAPILTTIGFAALLRAASLVEERMMDDRTSTEAG